MARRKKTRIYSALEVANICGVVNQTAINWIRKGHLKAFTTPGGQYRVYAVDFVDFLESHGMQVPGELAQQLQKDQGTVEHEARHATMQLLYVTSNQRQVDLVLQYVEERGLQYLITAVSSMREAFSFIADKLPPVVLYDPSLSGGSTRQTQAVLDSYVAQLRNIDADIPECIIEPFFVEEKEISSAHEEVYERLDNILVA